MGENKMYKVKVTIELENGERAINLFDFWGDAAAWIQYLADEGESLPKEVKMEIIR
jgi:hypothetical protein